MFPFNFSWKSLLSSVSVAYEDDGDVCTFKARRIHLQTFSKFCHQSRLTQRDSGVVTAVLINMLVFWQFTYLPLWNPNSLNTQIYTNLTLKNTLIIQHFLPRKCWWRDRLLHLLLGVNKVLSVNFARINVIHITWKLFLNLGLTLQKYWRTARGTAANNTPILQ
jgi:hypothetical protein